MARRAINTTIDEGLFKEIKLLAFQKDVKINELMERGLRLVLEEEKKKDGE
ncbi:hypothetical protein [Aneurinibacillus tyrosinisolvens]|uniref:hypothetical protein n=1 Tax=Aneurinibacillus tyrosinisolvens TaxID=1443435 RepID=UPI000AFAB780|nr:hypothetical protein [Aneurinibacillus tyrosinisolvens]